MLGKGYGRWSAPVSQATPASRLRNQARDLCSRIAGNLAQKAHDESTLAAAQSLVGKLLQAHRDPLIAILVRLGGKRHGVGAGHKRAYLFQAAQLLSL